MIEKIKGMKGNEKISMLTAYSYPLANIMDNEVDIILVGDSGVMVELGKSSTKDATMQDMIHFTNAVRRGAKKSPVVTDMPINTYNNKKDALRNAKLLLNAGADAVKIEGDKFDIITHLVNNNIAVMGHIGLLPQTAKTYTVQKNVDLLMQQARNIESAGAFALVIELVPSILAKEITENLSIPTIGIGAGVHCDGQVLVTNDILGMYNKNFKFVRKYFDFTKIRTALKKYTKDVKNEKFPNEKESF